MSRLQQSEVDDVSLCSGHLHPLCNAPATFLTTIKLPEHLTPESTTAARYTINLDPQQHHLDTVLVASTNGLAGSSLLFSNSTCITEKQLDRNGQEANRQYQVLQCLLSSASHASSVIRSMTFATPQVPESNIAARPASQNTKPRTITRPATTSSNHTPVPQPSAS